MGLGFIWTPCLHAIAAALLHSYRAFVGDDDSFSTDTSVALIIAKTASPFLRSIRLTEPVVMIEVTGPAAVLIRIRWHWQSVEL
jgi:hypothetical protein